MRFPILFLALSIAASAAAPYQRVASEHFEILAPRDPEAAAILGQLELARAFFDQSAKLHSPHARPPLVFVPSTEAQYLRMRGPALSYGFYSALPGRDAIVMQGLEPTLRRAAIHEYTHLALQYSGGRYPRWMNEGLAEYYSTLRAAGNRAEYGHVLAQRVQRLRVSPWMGILDLVTHGQATRGATAVSEDTFYAQSWLLVHMLMSSERYSQGWAAFREAVSIDGEDEAAAFAETYHRSVVEVGADMRAYFAAGKFQPQATVMTTQWSPASTAFDADEFDIEATTAAVEGWRGRKPEARASYQKLVRAGDSGCKWQRELGDVAESAGLFDDALHHRQEDLECRKDAAAACDLARGLGLHPSPAESLVELANQHLKGSEVCGFGFYWMGLRAYRARRWQQAATLFEQARGLPEREAEEVSRLREDANQRADSGTPPATDDTVEVIQATDKPPLSKTEGVLERATCTGAAARIDVRGKVAVFTFYVEDRAKFAGLACGAQKRNVSIGFEQVTLPRVGPVAAVRELQFH